MTYTLWSRGELLGESALDYVRVIPNLRTGDLQLTECGLLVAERLSQAREDCYRTARRVNKAESDDAAFELELKTYDADCAAQEDLYEALALELRAPNGSVIPTDDIYVTDTEYLIAIGREREEEGESLEDMSPDSDLDPDVLEQLEAEMKEFEDDHPPWMPEALERPPARFQIGVVLKHEWSIP